MKRIQVLAAVMMVGCGPEPAPVAPGGGSPTNPVAGPGQPGSEATPDGEQPNSPTPPAPELDPETPPPPPAPPPEAGVPARLKGILAAHNEVRARHCAPPLTWSAEVARTAQKWADKLATSGCGFDHSRGKYGENLAMASANSFSTSDVVRMWYDEIGKYDFGNQGFSMQTGHFTQVVWVGTTKLGCGTATCDSGMQVWVCNYDPPGNMQSFFEKNVLPRTCR